MTTQKTSDSNETLSKELLVQNKMGIHARPAAMIVRIANTYKGEVWVDKDDEQVNGKSIMGVMMLAAEQGAQITVKAEGEDAEAAVEALFVLLQSNFEEKS